MKMARKKAVKKFSWRKTTAKAKTDSSQTSANKRKKNYVSNQVHAATVQPICYTLRHYPGVKPRHKAWGQSSAHFLLSRSQRGTTHAQLHHWALLGTVPLMWPGDCREGERGTISSYHSLSEGRQQQKDPFCCLHLTEPGQKLTMSLSIQKHQPQFIIKSATAGRWMRGAPKHCLIYFCAAQNLDAERGLWNVSKMIIVFLLRLLNLSWLPKNIWETEINRFSYNPQTWKKVHKFASYWAKNPETQKLCLLQQIYPLLIKQLQLVLSSV